MNREELIELLEAPIEDWGEYQILDNAVYFFDTAQSKQIYQEFGSVENGINTTSLAQRHIAKGYNSYFRTDSGRFFRLEYKIDKDNAGIYYSFHYLTQADIFRILMSRELDESRETELLEQLNIKNG